MSPSRRQFHTKSRVGSASQDASSAAPSSVVVSGVLVIAAALAAGASWLIVRWLASRFEVAPPLAGIAAFVAAWTALYPFARLNQVSPSWSHWARGALVLLAFWLLAMFYR